MKHIEIKHPEEESGLLEEQPPREAFNDVRGNIIDKMHTDDPNDLPPDSTPISKRLSNITLMGSNPTMSRGWICIGNLNI